ncbi:hypothetical protein [Candidatus Phytoplasma sacchari]|nr:hypothetical protein [Candidatus Phytoplasma sacchari]KAB8121836.1 hypothetical protein F2B49_02065 [Candidatus Phytoplasma sacchari]
MKLLEVIFDINNNPILCFLNQEIVYFPKKNSKLVKEIIIIDPEENQIKHQWFFYQNQVLRSYIQYSFKHHKVINEKIYYASGQMKRYTEYDVVNGGFLYTANYDHEGGLNKKIGTFHVER